METAIGLKTCNLGRISISAAIWRVEGGQEKPSHVVSVRLITPCIARCICIIALPSLHPPAWIECRRDTDYVCVCLYLFHACSSLRSLYILYLNLESTCDAAEPLHGFSYCDDVGDARICSLECDANYRRSGPHMFMCRKKTGEWSPSLPELNKFPACINGKERWDQEKF